jgi:hypothetical protein
MKEASILLLGMVFTLFASYTGCSSSLTAGTYYLQAGRDRGRLR